MQKRIRSIAMYLPQFYPTIENDKWWGMGFTEWTNVTKAKPHFKGHYQPHLPADLGFYDLRVPEVRELQASLAKEYGIDGFCYYHYWFNGKRILERPFNEVIESGKPDFPFMLCWANENWARGWENRPNELLLNQEYSEEDDRKHIRYLLNIFKDPRYIKIEGKPVFSIYRSTLLPDISATLKIWRDEAAKEGMELYLCRFESYGEEGERYLDSGFDASIEFQPHSLSRESIKYESLFTRSINKLSRVVLKQNIRPLYLSYPNCVNYMCKQSFPKYKRFPCVMPMWDNCARKKNFMAFKGSTPDLYYRWIKHTVDNFKPFSDEENFIFINAWNEWGEGAHLEPCQKWGRQYLEKTKKALI